MAPTESTANVQFLINALRNALTLNREIIRINPEVARDLIAAMEQQQREIVTLTNTIVGMQHAIANAPKPNEAPQPIRYDRALGRVR